MENWAIVTIYGFDNVITDINYITIGVILISDQIMFMIFLTKHSQTTNLYLEVLTVHKNFVATVFRLYGIPPFTTN